MKKERNRRGRKPKHCEFIETLFDLSGLQQTEFAGRCDIATPNMNAYLRGKKTPGRRVITKCLDLLYTWQVTARAELTVLPKKLADLPSVPGVYVLYDSAGNVLYIGKAKNFKTEARQTLGRKVPEPVRAGPSMKKKHPPLRTLAAYYSLYEVGNQRTRHRLESILLRVMPNQTHNRNIGRIN